MEINAYIVKAFTKNKDEGNPAGVVLDADKMRDELMQKVASILGFSESVFIQQSSQADYRLRFFSPLQEVPLCGHNTIAAFHLLLEKGRIKLEHALKELRQETKAGVLSVVCNQDGLIEMTQAKPDFGFVERNAERMATLLSITPKSLLSHPIQLVSTGVPKLLIPVDSLQTLFEMRPDLEGIKEYCKETGARGFYPFTSETFHPDSDYHARQFNPLAGINEDPVTGVAAGGLAAYLIKHKLSSKRNFVIEQGNVLNMAGRIYVNAQDENHIKIGGYAVTVEKRTINF